ncbi:putative nuclease HARBI1 [Heptranchias perlo]|uniref:putative nuclease HARBI1 n=1 Tax=Heptranchias perlo TaxID=212740 RepID=UPI0035595B3C
MRRVRFTKESVTELCHLLQPKLESRTRARTTLPLAVKFTMALNLYATGSFQAATGDNSKILHFALRHCIREVTGAPYTIRNTYISFPMDRAKQDERGLGFTCRAGFPRVQGAIDCTQIALRAPYHQPDIFVNRKEFHSLNIHLVCNQRQRIMQVHACYPGSRHDFHPAPVLCLQSGRQVTGWLLGDKGYTFRTWLMTPIRNPRKAAKHAYSESHAAIRNIIDHTVGLLKQHFRCLDRHGGNLQYAPGVSRFVIACCIYVTSPS